MAQLILEQRKEHAQLLRQQLRDAPTVFQQHIEARLHASFDITSSSVPTTLLRDTYSDDVVATALRVFNERCRDITLRTGLEAERRRTVERQREAKRQQAREAATATDSSMSVAEQVERAINRRLGRKGNGSKSGHSRQTRPSRSQPGRTRQPTRSSTSNKRQSRRPASSRSRRPGRNTRSPPNRGRGPSNGQSRKAAPRRPGSRASARRDKSNPRRH